MPLLHVVAGDTQAGRPDFPELGRRLLEAWGPDLALHLRLKNATASRFLDLSFELSASAAAVGGWCVVNERLDVALAAGVQAVQLGRSALPVAVARELIRRAPASHDGEPGAEKEGPAIGASVHAEEEARAAVEDGASYIVLGTIFASLTHPGVRPHGTAIVERCRTIGAPVIGIGGIDARKIPALRMAGASGIAVVRAVWAAEDPVEASGRLIRAWSVAG